MVAAGRTVPIALAGIGPCSRTIRSVWAIRSGCSLATFTTGAHSSWSTRAIRQRKSGRSSAGISDA